MAKGEQRSNREVRKPKKDKEKPKTETVSPFKTQMTAASATKSNKPK